MNLANNDFYGPEIPSFVIELCARETTNYCEFTRNNRLCGNDERVIGYTCLSCPSKANCADNGECRNGFNSSDYFSGTCPDSSFDAGCSSWDASAILWALSLLF
ncbi:hypothetical protein TrLO_g13813 [Triparma laevis f. longispina]|uniref:Uncharacterized protein n=1 Tax=Triparma laevis f. longispina TaxID=1714387 RepID=A0A9W7A078_9STRA|nr:hypothetical protein TrLO_g13813 [Triparma laevis f. longispina]